MKNKIKKSSWKPIFFLLLLMVIKSFYYIKKIKKLISQCQINLVKSSFYPPLSLHWLLMWRENDHLTIHIHIHSEI